jgi:hypothetical protein
MLPGMRRLSKRSGWQGSPRRNGLAFLLLIACLGVSLAVRDGEAADREFRPTSMPGRVYVADFDLDPTLVQTESGPLEKLRQGGPLAKLGLLRGGGLSSHQQTPEDSARQLTDAFSATLVQELGKASVPAERLPPGAPLPQDAWLIRGQFVKVEEGNAAASAVVGFGMGAPHLEVVGDVSDLRTDPPASFLTFGGANKTRRMPGGIITKNPYVIAAKFVLAKGATERDVKQLATQMAGEIVTSLQEQQLLPAAH